MEILEKISVAEDFSICASDRLFSPFPPSSERDALVDIRIDPEEEMAQVVQKMQKSETISKNGPLAVAIGAREETVGAINSIQLHDAISSGSNNTTQHQRNQSSNSILSFPISLSIFSGVVPHLGYMSSPQDVIPTNGNLNSSTIIKYVLLGAIPFPTDVPHLKALGVGGVVTLNKPYKTSVPTSLYHVSLILSCCTYADFIVDSEKTLVKDGIHLDVARSGYKDHKGEQY